MKQSRSKTNVPVGTKFKYRNVWLEVVEDKHDVRCFFTGTGKCGDIKCSIGERTDRTSVKFKQIPTPNA